MLPIGYVINPANPQGLTDGFIAFTISLSAETWDAATSSECFNDSYTRDSSAAYGTNDFQNSIAFGDYADNNVIIDLQNIAAHEIGHATGLGDIYSDSCSAVTEYGYSGYGETQKRILDWERK